jgi:phosphoglycerate dehydrogenase-like enzyme
LAELTVVFLLALHVSSCQLMKTKVEKKSFEGDEIGGKTLGLIGIGNIGAGGLRRCAWHDSLAYDRTSPA